MDSRVERVPPQYAGAYRSFVTGKYLLYKQQKAGLTDKQILETIIREWESLDEETKKRLRSEYIDSNANSKSKNKSATKDKSQISWIDDDARSLSQHHDGEGSDQMEDEQQILQQQNQRKVKKPSPQRRILRLRKNDNKKDEEVVEQPKEELQEKRRITIWEEDSEMIHQSFMIENKKKRIHKVSAERNPLLTEAQNQYISFSIFYREKLRIQHPRWSTQQISNIIKLLWKKRKQTFSVQPQKPIQLASQRNKSEQKSFKKMSGKMAYRLECQEKGLIKQEIQSNWKKLPFESKKYWQRKGRKDEGLLDHNVGHGLKFMKKREDDECVMKNIGGLEWMSKSMK